MNDGGPAYPLLKVEHDDYGIKLVIVDAGLSKLEWFAGMATCDEDDLEIENWKNPTEAQESVRFAVQAAVRFKKAAAMLAEAEKRRRDAK